MIALQDNCQSLIHISVCHFINGVMAFIPDYGEQKKNKVMATAMGLKKEDWPVFKLYKKGVDNPVTYSGEITVDHLREWITSETGMCPFNL